MATRDGAVLLQRKVEGACCPGLVEGLTPNQIAWCQGALVEAPAGSNGARFLRTPSQRITSLRRHAPTACLLGLPAAKEDGPWPSRPRPCPRVPSALVSQQDDPARRAVVARPA